MIHTKKPILEYLVSTARVTRRVVALLMFGIFFSAAFNSPVHAGPATDFNPGKIIDDSVFTNATSLDTSQIQAFLNSKVPSCDTNGTQPASDFGRPDLTHAQYAALVGWPAPPYPCLKNYTENGLTSAQIIYNTSRTYAINPQVLIVLLQKEQGLVTDTWPLPSQYRSATGYGCPDTATCNSLYYGLTNQIQWAATLFRAVLNNSPTWYSPYVLGNNYIQWNPNASCGGTTVTILNRSTQALYDYTPYQPNQASLNAGYGTGDSCSSYGNRNFYLYFRDWFGYNSGPAAFQVAGSSTIYVPVDGYKLAVPYMAAMQDYGISADSVQTVSQSYVDAFPSPPVSSGVSSSISNVVKSPYDNDEDGASVYLISRGSRYKVQTMQQLYNMGFVDSDISYLPLSYIYSKNDGGTLSNFVTSPYGNVFKVSSLGKQIFFEYNTYIASNPSDQVTPLSYYLVDKINSGSPITSRPVLIKYSNSEFVTLYDNGAYYTVPDYSVFSCWGLQGQYGLPVYRLAQNNYVAPITPQSALSCVTNDGASTQILNQDSRYTVPTAYGLTGSVINADLKSLQERMPLRATPIKQYIKASGDSAVWSVESGKRRLIPSYTSFIMLGLTDSSVDTINPYVVSSIPTNGIKLADGQLVKSPSDAAVYVIAGGQRVLYSSSDTFLAYHNSWSSIETYASSGLDQSYPYSQNSVSDTLVDKVNSKAYLINLGSCFVLNDTSLTSLGTSLASLSSSQSYDSSIFKNLNLSSCSTATTFIRQPGQSLVYWLNAGQKYPLYTYTAMLSKNSGSSPIVMEVDPSILSSIPTGVGYY